MQTDLSLKTLPMDFTVCKLGSVQDADLGAPFCFLSRTDEEISLVCPTDHAPPRTLEREDGWRAFKIDAVLDFSLIGVIAGISTILAENGVGIFVLSTFNTDYVLVKATAFEGACEALRRHGYRVE